MGHEAVPPTLEQFSVYDLPRYKRGHRLCISRKCCHPSQNYISSVVRVSTKITHDEICVGVSGSKIAGDKLTEKVFH